ncbi:MAG: hypothetical protein JWM68_3599 [Verrucomicrobiales bacterium]|nr:hypothetical protein [Verrucomicrobiales bacterium]
MNKQRIVTYGQLSRMAALLFLLCLSSHADPLDSWTLRAQFGLFTGDNLFGVAERAGTTVAVGTIPGVIFYRTNSGGGWNWATNGLNYEYLYGVAADNKQLIAVGSAAYPAILVSSNGMDWKTVYTTGSGTPPLDSFRAVVCISNLTVVVGTVGRIAVSTNAINWTAVASGTVNDLKAVGYANGLFMAGDAAGGVLLSTNGLSWSRKQTATTAPINGITCANNLWVAVGGSLSGNGFIETSTNGIDWTLRLSSVSFRTSVAFYGGMFVAPGNLGSIYSSRDAISWSSRTNLASTHTLNSIIGTDSTLLAVGYSAVIVQSAPLVTMQASGGSVPQFTIFGLTNRSYQINKLDSLNSSNWLPAATLQLSNAAVNWVDTAATNSSAFYRAVLLP